MGIIEEIFKPIFINGIETHYEVSNKGNVRNSNTGKILQPEVSNCGYLRVGIYYVKDNRRYHMHGSVHRLVAIAFIPNPDNLPEVNHKDGNKTHNWVENLEWSSSSDNDYHAYATGLKKKIYGENSHLHKYSRDTIEKACKLMESGKYVLREISEMTEVPVRMLGFVRLRKSWCNVSKNYHIENCKRSHWYDGSHYSMRQMENVFRLLSENKLSIYDISDRTGVSVATIRNVVTHRKGLKQYESLYDKYDVSKYQGRKKVLNPLTNDHKKQIDFLIGINKSVDVICSIMNEEHHHNSQYIRDYIRRKYDK